MSEPRVEGWKRRLLDLSLRNRLLNCRDGKLVLPLDCDDVARLEDRISASASVAVESSLAPQETVRRLKEIYRAGRTAIEEAGVNATYAAVGFLEWRERAGADTVRRAPILLVPVRLTRQGAASSYRMARLDEDAHVNTTLVEFLRTEFGLSVPGIDPLPQDDSGADVPAVLAAFEAVVADRGWKVDRSAALGHFSFGKVALWKDLGSRLDEMRRNPLVDHLVAHEGTYDDSIAVFPPEDVARHIDPTNLFCPLGADASQLTAVLYSAVGKTFVLHGPPGTGKSQTITNLIVHNLALGRRVLFVSEKKAALDVVHRRLCAAGVGPFCLELHSNKSGKGHVLEQFAEAMAVPPTGAPSGFADVCRTLNLTRQELSAYVQALHKVWPNGLSAYDVLSRAGSAHPAASPDFIATACARQDRAAADALARRAGEVAAEWSGVDAEAFRALMPVRGMAWSPDVEGRVGEALATLIDAFARESNGGILAKLRRWFLSLRLRGVVRLPLGTPAAEGRAKLEAARAYLGACRLVFAYRMKRAAAIADGIGAFAAALEGGAFTCAEAERVFADSYAAKTRNEILSAERALAGFSGVRQEDLIRKFRETDRLMSEAVKRNVFARLAARLPDGRSGDCPDRSELGILKRECAKKARQKPVRQLLAETKGVCARLKPCFLMSPLSVSQYLPPDSEPFDLVVFDEASQMPVWDAVGAIARGRQLIVVGDPKQMPPTNFFQKGDGAADDEPGEGVEDLESILDESLALGLHSAYLDWHYRSRDESLIAFSNAHYYGDRLNTFPSARHSPRQGVSLHFVEGGVYDARGRRTNEMEARAVVDWIFAEAERPDARPMGVVTFSLAQKDLIEDMVERRCAERPELAAYFDESREDPFFVKNLENVQGDERDVMLFSVCYAPDANGDFAMNFGPLNRAGGERRLNVAVTRAREQVVVFASIKPEQIDLSRTKAIGAAHLREFIAYAMRGGVAPSGGGTASGGAALGEVAEFLESHGYSTVCGVGASNRRVDLAVRRRGKEDGYLLGILGDGPGYGADRTVRDRDALRVDVLQNLGWNVFRLWSVDWALDRAGTEKRLLDALSRLEADPSAKIPGPVSVPPDELKRALRPLPPPGRASAAPPRQRRAVDTVPPDELRAMRNDVLRTYGSCPDDVVYREITRRLGYATMSPKARDHLARILGGS
ncbi:MAG: DUF4011 domain-containing protein [Kiritimatiellae bacterium]|nr:DUF4011 domain-containing protein [Kiritimatiellia bacterium]